MGADFGKAMDQVAILRASISRPPMALPMASANPSRRRASCDRLSRKLADPYRRPNIRLCRERRNTYIAHGAIKTWPRLSPTGCSARS
jgi:hypothetical protein